MRLVVEDNAPSFFHVKTKRGVTCYTDYKGMPQLPCYIHAIVPSKKEGANIEHNKGQFGDILAFRGRDVDYHGVLSQVDTLIV